MDQLEHLLPHVFAPDAPVAFFPIRHHSPACSYHVKKAIESYNPDCVLIEGPCDTDELILCLYNATPPVSIYYTYQHENERYACYYPILDYSPELVAMKTAISNKIPVHFIDLPYGNLVEGEKALEKKISSGGRQTYYDDYFLARSRYVASLCEKENCRNYSELWEKLFEIPTIDVDTETFVKNMFTLCYYSRIDYPEELLIEEQNPAREVFMAAKIMQYQSKHKRILIVTGGFHTAALMELIKGKKIPPVKSLSGNAYLIPYSFEECDQLTGYESGMPYPGYYQAMYDLMMSGEINYSRKAILLHITHLAKNLRKNRENISLSEEAAAFAMCLGLADLRGKNQPGVYEFLDGIRSCFVKGELNLSTSFVMNEAVKLLRGERNGKIDIDAPIPPIVNDFVKTAKSFRMDISTSVVKSLTLDIISKPQHREQSVFLHRLVFLDSPYAKKTGGPDYERRTDAKLIREKWDYAFSGRVTSALIEKSHLGGTIEEACESKLSDLITDHCHSSADVAALLVKAGVLALFAHARRLTEVVVEAINNDYSFVSLVNCIERLSFLRGIEHVLRISRLDKLEEAEQLALSRVIPMIQGLTANDEKDDFALAQSIKMLNRIAAEKNEAVSLLDALEELLANRNTPPALDGAATGLLYNASRMTIEGALNRANAYFAASDNVLTMSGRFLRGLFLTAKDLVFYDGGFLEGLNGVVKDMAYNDFITLLPDLRLSFTSFSPREIDLVSRKTLEIMGLDGGEITFKTLPALDENDLKLLMEIDRKAMQNLAI
ncbi:MAG: DUF5682 family protein [Tannerella sp.]|nr:DUF5682 family protein [Tannerella sp.]